METRIKIYPIKIGYMKVSLEGDSPLLVNKYYETGPNHTKDPDEIIKLCVHYLNEGGYGYPGSGIKASIVAATNSVVKGVTTKAKARGGLFVVEYLAPILNSQPKPYTRMVKTDRGLYIQKTSAQFDRWAIPITLRFLPGVLSPEQIINLIQWAGVTIGLGEFAPRSKGGGSFGTFHVNEAIEIAS